MLLPLTFPSRTLTPLSVLRARDSWRVPSGSKAPRCPSATHGTPRASSRRGRRSDRAVPALLWLRSWPGAVKGRGLLLCKLGPRVPGGRPEGPLLFCFATRSTPSPCPLLSAPTSIRACAAACGTWSADSALARVSSDSAPAPEPRWPLPSGCSLPGALRRVSSPAPLERFQVAAAADGGDHLLGALRHRRDRPHHRRPIRPRPHR